MQVDGISGSLLPGGYLSSAFAGDALSLNLARLDRTTVQRASRAWRLAAGRCGPATSVRALFDFVAEPLFAALGYRTVDWSLRRDAGEATLRTSSGVPVALVLLPWGASATSAWRDAFRLAKAAQAEWAFILAPPFLTLARVSGASTRQRLDFSLPVAVDHGPDHPFWRLASAAVFGADRDGSPPRLLGLIERAARYQAQVTDDLQSGVAEALDVLAPLMGRHDGGDLPPARSEQALTIVYRLMFLLFAESRDLVPAGHPVYSRSYSVERLAAEVLDGVTRGCWDAMAAMTRLARLGCRSPLLDCAPFGGRLFARAAAPALEARSASVVRAGRTAPLTDQAGGRALVALASRPGRAGRERISYRDLGVEQLGAVYERLLDGHGGVRKTTGTFYTPQPLAEFLVRRTLAPLVEGASADRILTLRVVDPSMGSGACLVAACRYLAAAYERALLLEERAAPGDFDDHARADLRRLIAERCLAGVDRNPMAVELARLSLWLTTLARGKPLGFLDHRLTVGDSLVGAWPDDLRRPLGSRRGASEHPLFEAAGIEPALGAVSLPLASLVLRRDDTLDDVRQRATLWRTITSATSPLEPWRRAASLWCARWFWPAESAPPADPELRALVAAVLAGDTTLPDSRRRARLASVAAAERSHAFLHWPMAFPDVFHESAGVARTARGFDAVIGNPPWEMLRQDGRGRDGGTARLVRYIRESGQYPSCTSGHVNLYQAFVDRSLALVRPGGRVGLVLPWGLASDDGAAGLRRRLFETTDVDTIVGCDNARRMFPIHRGIRFLVLTTTTGSASHDIRARFGVMSAADLDRLPERDDPLAPAYPVRLSRRRIEAVSGPALRIPDARQAGDLELIEELTRRFPRLGDPSGWGVAFGRELNATEARPHFGPLGLPVIEGKHISPFRVRTQGCARIEPAVADRLLPAHPFDHARLAYRDVSGVGNVVSLIAAIVPAGCVTSHTLFCLKTPLPAERQFFLLALFNSYVLNFVVRMLMGGHVTTTLVEGLPAVPWRGSAEDRWVASVACRLAARGPGAPDEEAELQARIARLFGLDDAGFTATVGRFPLVPEASRRRAVAAFRSLLPVGPRK